MVDILGPAASTVGAVTVRPTDERTWGAPDTWFADCSSETAEDGTDIRSSWFNGITAVMRSLWRMNGKLADNVTPVILENGSDDNSLAAAVQHMVQRGTTNFAIDTGTINAVLVTLAPVPLEYKAGLEINVLRSLSNTGPVTIRANGLGVIDVKRTGGAPLQRGDMPIGISKVFFNGVYFELLSAQFRETLFIARTYYVATTGSDANDGLTPGTPFLTIQKAIDVIAQLNTNGYAVLIQCADGTYTTGAYILKSFFGGGSVTLQGNLSNPQNCRIQVNSGPCITLRYAGELTVQGFILRCNDPLNNALQSSLGGTITIGGNMIFDQCAAGHIVAQDGGQVVINAPYTIAGGAYSHWSVFDGGRILTGSFGFVLGNNPNFTGQFAGGRDLGFILAQGCSFSGAATGQKFLAVGNTVIDTSGAGINLFPGNVAGVLAAGGQYL